MDKTTIATLARKMETKDDLLLLLNCIMSDKAQEGGDERLYYPFKMPLLLYYCNPNHSFHRYRQFRIRKKSGGYRQITAPRNKSFMCMLRCVNEIYKALYTSSEFAMGFAEGRSVVDNALKHKGMNYVFNIDLKDFFPSIEQARLWKRLQLKPLNFPEPIANVLAGLCSMREERLVDGIRRMFYVLPQGAPTSPIITNMICDTLDRRLSGLAKRFGLNYSRYADDITFSSMHNVYKANGDFITELKRIISGQGFTINESKTRLQKLGSHQEVTGLVVSHKVNVNKDYVRDIRNILYIWDRYGYMVAACRLSKKYNAEKGHVKRRSPSLSQVIEGKLLYLKMVKGEKDPVYQRLNAKFLKLDAELSRSSKTNEHGITIETIPMLEFERKNHTLVSITHKQVYLVTMSDTENTEDGFIARWVVHRSGVASLNGKKIYMSVSKYIRREEETKKELLSISNCKDASGKQFWLIHTHDKFTGPQTPEVDIDELNNDLDSLLSM